MQKFKDVVQRGWTVYVTSKQNIVYRCKRCNKFISMRQLLDNHLGNPINGRYFCPHCHEDITR